MQAIPYNAYLPLGSALIAGVFTVLMLQQYHERKKTHQLIWAASLIGYTAVTFLEFVASLVANNPAVFDGLFKVYYLVEAPGISLFGIGTLFLLKYRKIAFAILAVNIVLTAGLWITGIFGPWTWNFAALQGSFDNAPVAVPSIVRAFAIPMNIYGALLLIVGSLFSFGLDRTKYYNLLIAGGAIVQSISGAAIGVWNFPLLFYPFELIGTFLLFVGFLKSREWVPKPATVSPALDPSNGTAVH